MCVYIQWQIFQITNVVPDPLLGYQGKDFMRLIAHDRVDELDQALDRSTATSRSPATLLADNKLGKRHRIPSVSVVEHARLITRAIRWFRDVHCCFGTEKRCDTEDYCAEFKAAYLATGASVTPCVHMVFEHVAPFVRDKGPLGHYAEYAHENIHDTFKKHHKSYAVSPQKKSHMPKMETSVELFNIINAT